MPVSVFSASTDPLGPPGYWPLALKDWKKERFTTPPAGKDVAVHVEGLNAPGQRFVVAFGPERVAQIFGDPDLYSSIIVALPPGKTLKAVGEVQSRAFIYLDGEVADAQRTKVAPPIRRAKVTEKRRLGKIGQRAAETIDLLGGGAPLDFVEDLTIPYTFRVICDLFGVPEDKDKRAEMREYLGPVAAAVLNPFLPKDQRDHAQTCVAPLRQMLQDVIDTGTPSELMSTFINATGEGKAFSTIADRDAGMLLTMGAGHETTANFLANVVRGLLLEENREQLRQLMENINDRQFMASAMEELLRYYGPVQFAVRILTADTEIDGLQMKKGEKVFLASGALGFDERDVPRPDELILDRYTDEGKRRLGKSLKPMPFGHGVHMCIGAELAKLEAEIFLRELFQRYPNLEAVDRGRRRENDFAIAGYSGFIVKGGDGAALPADWRAADAYRSTEASSGIGDAGGLLSGR